MRVRILELSAAGASYRVISNEVGVSQGVVWRVLKPVGGLPPPARTRSPNRLSIEDRIEIRLGLERGWSVRKIARAIHRHASTVCREVNHNGGPRHYAPMEADRRAFAQARRPKLTKLASNPALRRRVIADLRMLWSPEQIAKRLRADFGDDTTMQVSHETIYRSLYVQGRGALRKELAACLRTGRATRKPQGGTRQLTRFPDMVMISERPAEVEDRAVPGHWEGDLIFGKDNHSAIGTLVERSTRYVMLLHLPEGKGATAVRDAMTRVIKSLPASLRRSITWDQGNELAEHARFTVDTGVQVYFCDPHSPWQRGSNENTNGLLRQYFPKGTDLSVHGPEKLREVADGLNGRPRKTLGWKTPAEKLAELVAVTG